MSPTPSVSRARLRYLSAIGALVPSAMLVGCKDPAQSPSTADASATATGTATASVVATGSAEPPPSAVDATPPPHPTFRMPTCPSGKFCVAEGTRGQTKDAAPAPYDKCPANPSVPGEGPDAGFHPHYSVSFSVESTVAERTASASASASAKACCYTWVIPCPGGRAFRDATGTPSVARSITRSDWALAIGDLALGDLAPAERAALAAHWAEQAAFEHASIASFAQLTLDLLSIGAPPDLLEATQRATLDEIAHAKITFALATAYGGAPIGPAALSALPGASRTLAAVARSTFIDACVGESVASAALAESSRRASDPVLRDLLATMAADEERHAELAWRIVAWCLRAGDDEVARVLHAAKDEVTAELVSLTGAADEPRAMVLREVVLPCTVALLGPAPAERRGVRYSSRAS